jgi:PAS domain S-box-containing protein
MSTSFFVLEADYLQFLTGLAFFVLASVCFSLRRIPTPLLSWASLGWFGVLFGGCQWVECASFNNAQWPALEAMRSVLFAGATACLLLFSAKELIPRWVSQPWLRLGLNLLPLVILAAVIDLGGVHEYELAVFFFLAATATYCARRMWRSARFSRVAKSPLGLATISMVLLALSFLMGSPKESWFPSSVMNREVFARSAGFSISYVYIAVALLLAASLWQAYQYAVQSTARVETVWRKSWFGFQMTGVLVLLACGGWVLTQQSGEKARKKYGEDLMTRASAVAAALDVRPMLPLTGTLDDMTLPEYGHLRGVFTRIQKSSPDVRNVYLYGPRDGKSINYVASASPGQDDDIVPGTVYTEALDEEDKAFFRTGTPYVSKPYTDRWGTWVSALVGMLPDKAGPDRFKLALGLDVSASAVEYRVSEARFLVIQQIALLSVILMGFFQFRHHWWDRARQLEINQAVVLELSRKDFESFPAALEHVAQTLAMAVDVEHVSVWRYTDDRSAIICEESYSLSENRHDCGEALRVRLYPSYFQALESRPFLDITDTRVDERTRGLTEDYLKSKRILSLLDAQILRHGKIQGILCIEHTETIRTWTHEEAQLVLAIVDMLALLMERDERRVIESQKYESEERYRRVFEHSPEAIMVLDVEDRLVELNRRALAIIGSPSELLLGKAISEWPCFVEESRVRVKEQMGVFKEGQRVEPCELELLTGTGDHRIGLLYAAPLRGPAGSVVGNLVIISDITQIKRGEAMLKGTLNELERHNRLMTGREARILELKQEVNALRAELARPPAYQSVLATTTMAAERVLLPVKEGG